MKIAILGAGNIGSYIGGSFIAAGGDVVLIVRSRMAALIKYHELHLSDLHGHAISLPASKVMYSEDPSALADAELILVTVHYWITAGRPSA